MFQTDGRHGKFRRINRAMPQPNPLKTLFHTEMTRLELAAARVECFSCLTSRRLSSCCDGSAWVSRTPPTSWSGNTRWIFASPSGPVCPIRPCDSNSILWTSVRASWQAFSCAAAGQYDLHQPGQLVGLLTRMAQNKLAMQARSHHQQRRDVRRVRSINDLAAAPADKSPGPGRQAVDRDLLQALL